jgi:hypothetical protein
MRYILKLVLKTFWIVIAGYAEFLCKQMRFSGPGHVFSVHTLFRMISLMVGVTLKACTGVSMESMLTLVCGPNKHATS